MKPIELKTPRGFEYFDYDEIVMFQVMRHNALCYTVENISPIQIIHSLTSIEKKYSNENFFKCSRSTIVNLKHVKNLEVKSRLLHLTNNHEVKISWRCLKLIKRMYAKQEYMHKIKQPKGNFNHHYFFRMKIFRLLRIIIKRKSAIINSRKFPRKLLVIFFPVAIIGLIWNCESKERFYRPDLPEQLCSIGIIDIDDTLLRHISFEKSYQSEYPEEVNDSLRKFSFAISSAKGELFRFHGDSAVKRVKDFRIPDSIAFAPDKRYYLSAKEKNCGEIFADIIVPEPPSTPEFISIKKEITTISKPLTCIEVDTAVSAILDISFSTLDNQYYALLMEGSGGSLSSIGIPLTGFLDFSIRASNTPGFFATMQGLKMYHYICVDKRLTVIKSPTVYAYFIEGKKVPESRCLISLAIQFNDNYCVYDAFKAFRLKLLAIPSELYLFEKGLYTYSKTSNDPFTEPIYLKGNIKGGNGVFALCRSSELRIKFSHLFH